MGYKYQIEFCYMSFKMKKTMQFTDTKSTLTVGTSLLVRTYKFGTTIFCLQLFTNIT